MELQFTKMQSLGNDFVLLDGVSEDIGMTAGLARQLADRHFGIGCDQILLAEHGNAEMDFRLRIFNHDGSEVGQCGNGARCFARFLTDKRLTDKSTIHVETVTTRMVLTQNADDSVTVNMGRPEFLPERIPLNADRQQLFYEAVIGGRPRQLMALSLGNPHSTEFVSSVDEAQVAETGATLQTNPLFPERVNAGFAEIVSETAIRLRVYERGAGETLGCGSGACAAVVNGIRIGRLSRRVNVNLPGGAIEISWPQDDAEVTLRGPVNHVFDGVITVAD